MKDGKLDSATREPEQMKAFRDTWKDGIHSYLTYLRDRMTVGRDLLTESGSIFVQVSDENVHRVRALMDEIFGEENYVSEIIFSKTTGLAASGRVSSAFDYLLWYAKSRSRIKYRSLKADKSEESKSRFSSVLEIDGSTTPASQHTDKNETFKLITDTDLTKPCLLYTSPSPRDRTRSRMPSSA